MFAGEKIKSGQVISEFVGEVIDPREKRRRIEENVAAGSIHLNDFFANIVVKGSRYSQIDFTIVI